MTEQELIDLCLTFEHTYWDRPFDKPNEKNPTTVIRHQGNKKMFALIGRGSGRLGVNLKCDPEEADFLRNFYQDVHPGWHMNKTHWNTVHINGDVTTGTLEKMIQASYDLTKPKKPEAKKYDIRKV